MSNWQKLKSSLHHAFKITDGRDEFTDQDRALLDRLAHFLVKRHLAFPAIIFARTSAPLNFVGSSLLTFLKPTIGWLFTKHDYDRITELLTKRSCAEMLIEHIEKRENAHDV